VHRLRHQLRPNRQGSKRRLEFVRKRRYQVGALAFLVADESHVLEQQDSSERRAARPGPRQLAAYVGMVAPAQKNLELRRSTLLAGAARHDEPRDVRIMAAERIEHGSRRRT